MFKRIGLVLVIFMLISKLFAIEVNSLLCEHMVNPLGIDKKNPRFSWKIESDKKNVLQKSYHILVASSKEILDRNEGDVWDSGIKKAESSLWINYEGKELESRKEYFWKVKVVTNKGKSSWSEPAYWSMGFLDSNEWSAQWIGLDKLFDGDTLANKSRLSARYLRKEFELTSQNIKRATIYITGLGQYEAYINNEKIGDAVLAPTLTDFLHSVKYNTFDITENIKSGDNIISVILGNGRYFSTRYEGSGRMRHFGFPKLLAQIEIEFENGEKQIIVSDKSWKITPFGPIVSNNEFDGEVYDARKEIVGWTQLNFDDSQWYSVELVKAPEGKLSAQMNPNLKIMEEIKPIKIMQQGKKQYVVDMGQNMVGWLHLKIRNSSSGDVIKMRFAENINPDGTINTANFRRAEVTDYYICKGERVEEWEPKFVYHGFRYIEISGGDFQLSDFTGKVIYDEMETVGSFETSEPLLNQIFKNAYWGIRGNYRSFPTDCPQRDERQGWLGDRTTNVYGEAYIFDNYNLYYKWLEDIRFAQRESGSIPDVVPNFWVWPGYTDNVTWPHAYFTIVDMLLNQYGDVRAVEENYVPMKKWIDMMRFKYLKDGIMTNDRYGDWCVPPESPKMIHSKDSTRITDGDYIGTAFYYRTLDIMQKYAKILNKSEDIESFENEKEQIKLNFNERFFDKNSKTYSNNTATANLIALAFDLVPTEYRDVVVENLISKIKNDDNSHISTGVIGTQWLMRGLTENRYGDLALKIATNRDYPSWGYMIDNGATTIWELWNGNTANPSMNSGNHVMLLGDLIIWFYQYIGGIRPMENSSGFKEFILKPEMYNSHLEFCNTSFNSPYGIIESNWRKQNDYFEWDFTIPANSSAIVYIPGKNKHKKKKFKSGNYTIKSKMR